MESRAEKFKDTVLEEQPVEIKSRSSRNQELYHNISNEELDSVTIKANSSVLTDDVHNINIAQVRDMLDKKYRDDYDRKTINIPEQSSYEEIEFEKTREYDINQILNSAKSENAKNDYNEERLKKLRDTQFDILKNLDLKEKDTVGAPDDPKSMGLMELINTITENELTNTTVDPLDILSDLKGDENTKMINTTKLTQAVEVSVTNNKEEKDVNTLTDSIEFNNSDFDDFDDINKTKSNKIVLVILFTLLGIGFVAGLVVLLNYILGWGLF
ncbi:MAG: hypothetical protein J5892_02675 [Bacilli bacterium]|nr:hypothetical protein [Bacilli bacterium]